MGVAQLQQEFDLTVRWVPFPLHPDTPPEGRRLDDLFAGTGMDVVAMLERLRTTARGLGLPLGERRHTYNSRGAQELAEWAASQGRGEAFRTAAYRAYFVDGANLADAEVLTALASAAGLPAAEARQVLTAATWAPAVDAHWRRAATLGVRAVPTHRTSQGATAEGFHPYPALRRFWVAQGAGVAPTRKTEA